MSNSEEGGAQGRRAYVSGTRKRRHPSSWSTQLYWVQRLHVAGQRVDITRQFLTPSLYCPQVSAPETEWVDACHYLALQSSGQPYTFTNGSAFPPNNPSSPYAISPMYCNVSVCERSMLWATAACIETCCPGCWWTSHQPPGALLLFTPCPLLECC